MKKLSLLVAVAVFSASCNEGTKKEQTETENVETEAIAMENPDTENDWTDLFNGEDLEGWKAYNSEELSDQWSVQDEAIVFTPTEGERSGSENLITKDKYTNFVLSLDWKISEGGNSGIMWGVQEGEEFSEPYYTGPEIQVLDNERHPDAKNGPIRQAGALYDLVAPSEDAAKPAGEWNETVITINYKENLGSVTLNGTKVTEFPLHGEEWEKLVGNSKFKDWEHFGKYKTGHIALQDHGNKVSYRNIKIKELD